MGDTGNRCPNEEVKQSVIDLIGAYADDALDMVCGEFGNNGNKCIELLNSKEDGTEKDKSKEGKRNAKSRIKSSSKTAKSILPYFVNIFGKM